MTRWPASKARSEAIMSTIVRAASTPESSSAPRADAAVGRAGGGAGEEGVALLAGVRDVEDAELRRVDGAVGAGR